MQATIWPIYKPFISAVSGILCSINHACSLVWCTVTLEIFMLKYCVKFFVLYDNFNQVRLPLVCEIIALGNFRVSTFAHFILPPGLYSIRSCGYFYLRKLCNMAFQMVSCVRSYLNTCSIDTGTHLCSPAPGSSVYARNRCSALCLQTIFFVIRVNLSVFMVLTNLQEPIPWIVAFGLFLAFWKQME